MATTAPSALTPGQPVKDSYRKPTARALPADRFEQAHHSFDGRWADFDLYAKAEIRWGEGRRRLLQVGLHGVPETITIDNLKSGKYSILVHSYSGSGNYTLEVDTA